MERPGEWHHDHKEGFLYVGVAPGTSSPGDKYGTLYGPTAQTIFSVQGSQQNPVVGFRASSLIFQHVAPAYLEPYAVPSGGDYTVHKGGAVLLNGTAHATVDHCLFDGLGGNGVFMNDYTRNASVVANEFRDLGEAAVLMSGSTEWVDGTGGNQPRFNTVAGNYIHNVGLYAPPLPPLIVQWGSRRLCVLDRLLSAEPGPA